MKKLLIISLMLLSRLAYGQDSLALEKLVEARMQLKALETTNTSLNDSLKQQNEKISSLEKRIIKLQEDSLKLLSKDFQVDSLSAHSKKMELEIKNIEKARLKLIADFEKLKNDSDSKKNRHLIESLNKDITRMKSDSIKQNSELQALKVRENELKNMTDKINQLSKNYETMYNSLSTQNLNQFNTSEAELFLRQIDLIKAINNKVNWEEKKKEIEKLVQLSKTYNEALNFVKTAYSKTEHKRLTDELKRALPKYETNIKAVLEQIDGYRNVIPGYNTVLKQVEDIDKKIPGNPNMSKLSKQDKSDKINGIIDANNYFSKFPYVESRLAELRKLKNEDPNADISSFRNELNSWL